jgi:hypothetical protein
VTSFHKGSDTVSYLLQLDVELLDQFSEFFIPFMEVFREGLRSQVSPGQNGTGEPSFFQCIKSRARESRIRTIASKKGKKPGPGCLNVPMES